MKIVNWFKENYILTIILALAAFLRIYRADFQSIAVDEILSMNNSNPKLTLKELYDSVLLWEYMPPMYFYYLRFVFEIFGFTPLVGRLFSAFIGVVGVYSIYLLGKALFNRRVGLIAALFLSVNYFHIFYSQEIRLYGMLFLFTTLSFYRLVIFIKKCTLKNAIYYGIFTGLIINSHFFGFITIFSQCLILLYFILKSIPEDRKKLFINSLIAGGIVLLLILPNFNAIKHMLEVESFWAAAPGPNIYENLIKDFFGNSEMILFGVGIIFMSYFLAIFNEKGNDDVQSIKKNQLTFSAIILFVWITISLLIPLLKSHLDVSMIIHRYFISVIGAILIALAIGTEIIKNNTIKAIVIIYITVFSITDLFVVKKYYSTVNKTQFREMAASIREKNPDKSKIVTYWPQLFPYFFSDQPEIKIEGGNIQDYVMNLRNKTVPMEAFWYSNTGANNFEMPPDLKAFLDDNFYLKEKIELSDIWANYYVPKVETAMNLGGFSTSMFSSKNFDAQGNLMLFENVNLRTKFFTLEKGNYTLVVNATSTPEQPLKGENAHFKIKMNGIEIANYYLSEKPGEAEKIFPFTYDKDEKVRFQLIYDNDLIIDDKDRNAIIHSMKLLKK